QALAKAGFAKDLDYCAKINKVSAVSYWKDGLFLRDNTPKPKRPLFAEGKSKSGSGGAQKGKSIKVTVPLFPKNPEHPIPGAAKAHPAKNPETEAADKKKTDAKKSEPPPPAGKK